jgi:hypothetical protein
MATKWSLQSKDFWQRFLWLTVTLALTNSMAVAQGQSHAAGNWSGRFSSHNYASFPVSFAITQDAHGHLHGKASIVHPCIKDSTLIVTMVGNNIVLAGSDADGDTITFRGNIDNAGTLLNLGFVLNGSPSGRCETDQGEGSLGKQ